MAREWLAFSEAVRRSSTLMDREWKRGEAHEQSGEERKKAITCPTAGFMER